MMPRSIPYMPGKRLSWPLYNRCHYINHKGWQRRKSTILFSCFNLDAISFLYIFALEIADTLRLMPCYTHLNKIKFFLTMSIKASAAKLRIDREQIKDFMFLTLGVIMYAFGYTAFILPEKFVMGGVSGCSALLYYAWHFPPAYSIWLLNFLLLGIAIKTLSRQFIVRTVLGVTILSIVVAVFQPFFAAHPVITAGEDRFMHLLIGAVLGGGGLGLIYSHNGSTGGTDIVIAMLNKYFRMSFGRAMQFVDITIISSSYLLFHSTETIVYGVAFTLIASYMCDYVVNGARQTVQFIIISRKYQEIADVINNNVRRGVTVVEGKGWYSKNEVNLLVVMARRHESQDIYNYIKKIDSNALVSQTNCQGIFGEGFDNIK